MTGAITFSAVAKAANVTRRTLYKWRETGKFKLTPIDGTNPPRYSATEVAAWLKTDISAIEQAAE